MPVIIMMGFVFSSALAGNYNSQKRYHVVHDTIYVDLKGNQIKPVVKVVRSKQDFMNEKTLTTIKRYVAICNKNSKNKKYLLGWLNRTLRNNVIHSNNR